MRVVLSNVAKRFGRREVLADLSAEWRAPNLIALMGPSGSGKSTVLALLAGELLPDRGFISVEEDGAGGRPLVTWVLQNTPMLARRAAIDNVAIGPLARGVKSEESVARAQSAMRQLGVEELAGERTYKLSGGERQRIAIARALATGSDLLLADEPTASLDAVNRDLVVEALQSCADSGALVLVATHDSAVADCCDDIFLLRPDNAEGGSHR